jgi:hypothetical protein
MSNLHVEIQCMWNIKCFVIPVITVATGNVTKGLIRYQEIIRGKHSVGCLQNTARLDKPHFERSTTKLSSTFWAT